MEYYGGIQNEEFYFSSTRSVGIQVNKHHHSLFEIYYMRDGTCSYLIDNSIYDVIPGDIVLIPSGIIHKANYGKNYHTRLLINCSEGYIPDTVKKVIAPNLYLYRNRNTQKEIEDIYIKIEREIRVNDEYRDGILFSLTQELFYIIARNHDKVVKTSNGNTFIEDCLKYVQDNYSQPITLTDVAKKHSVSAEHLSRMFKRETGFGFNEFVNLVRLQKAEDMLKNENGKTVSEIAYACGFNDSNYFSVTFKKTYGKTPSAFKKGI